MKQSEHRPSEINGSFSSREEILPFIFNSDEFVSFKSTVSKSIFRYFVYGPHVYWTKEGKKDNLTVEFNLSLIGKVTFKVTNDMAHISNDNDEWREKFKTVKELMTKAIFCRSIPNDFLNFLARVRAHNKRLFPVKKTNSLKRETFDVKKFDFWMIPALKEIEKSEIGNAFNNMVLECLKMIRVAFADKNRVQLKKDVRIRNCVRDLTVSSKTLIADGMSIDDVVTLVKEGHVKNVMNS